MLWCCQKRQPFCLFLISDRHSELCQDHPWQPGGHKWRGACHWPGRHSRGEDHPGRDRDRRWPQLTDGEGSELPTVTENNISWPHFLSIYFCSLHNWYPQGKPSTYLCHNANVLHNTRMLHSAQRSFLPSKAEAHSGMDETERLCLIILAQNPPSF